MSSDKKDKPETVKRDAGGQKDAMPDTLQEPLRDSNHPKVTCEARPPTTVSEGSLVTLYAKPTSGDYTDFRYEWTVNDGNESKSLSVDPAKEWIAYWDTTGVRSGNYEATVCMYAKLFGKSGVPVEPLRGSPPDSRCLDQCQINIAVMARPFQSGDRVSVSLQRSQADVTFDLPLWIVIQRASEAISFDNYLRFMDLLLCGVGKETSPAPVSKEFDHLRRRRFLPYNDVDAYRLLKVATEAFLMVNCAVTFQGRLFTQEEIDDLSRRTRIDGRGVNFDNLWSRYLEDVNGFKDATIPYLAIIQRKLKNEPLKRSVFGAEDESIDFPENCVGILSRKLTNPCLLELIWSYWHEEGMLVQTMNAISLRFQNIGRGDRDPLRMMEIDPLRPLSNLMWGRIQDEQHGLTVPRRALEYSHHYGLTLQGKAVPPLHPADNRSKFIEAFHNLLYLTTVFYASDDDTTVIADGFPLLNALREVHFLLGEGAHNQFGDLPSTARQEMLIQQWVLARPEFLGFLPARVMVALPEPWMDRVDAMKTLQGWTDVSVFHFNRLGVFGERILLSIRFGAWSIANDPSQAANWARFWRAEIQSYIHSYRSVTGVDLTVDITDKRQAEGRNLLPSVHLRKRLEMQRRVR
jgi:hypothetical protein